MLKQRSYILPLILLLTCSQLAFAQNAQEPKSRETLIREWVANLESDDIHVAARAARELGYLRATESVPALLRVLQSSRHLSLSEHLMAKDNSVSEWVLTDVRVEIVNAMGRIGAKRAVRVLKKYLKEPPKNSEVYPGAVAYALFQINGKSYKYRDRDGRVRLFQPPAGMNTPAN